MKLGIIGLPRSGKATVFEALTKNFIDAGHKGEDRIGTIRVPDSRVDVLSRMYSPKKTIYAQVEYYLPMIAGKQKDALAWSPVRDSDALIHVVRNFGGYGFDDPTPHDDFVKLNQEMILADLVVVEKRLERLELDRKRGKKEGAEEYSLLIQCREKLENEIPLRKFPELVDAIPLKGFAFVSAKPMMVLFNNEDDDDNLPDAKDQMAGEYCMVMRGKLEHELSQMSDEEAVDFLSEFNITASAMDRVIKESYDLLGLISFFTVGEDEVRAWTIKKGTPAREAASVIHTDMQKGFIRAEVLSYDDLMDAGTFAEARKKGTVRLEGKTYMVENGDIINFRFNV